MTTVSDWLSGFIAFVALSAISLVIWSFGRGCCSDAIAVNLLGQTQYKDLENAENLLTHTASLMRLKWGDFCGGLVTHLAFMATAFASIVLSVFWTAYAFSQIAKVDGITEHASLAERAYILKNTIVVSGLLASSVA